MQTLNANSPQAVVVVILREFLVARDIEMIIRNCWAEARVILARTLDEAAAAVPTGRIKAAFVQMDAEDFAASDLSRRVASDGGQTVLVGLEAAELLPQGWAALPFPFADRHVTDLLTGVCCP